MDWFQSFYRGVSMAPPGSQPHYVAVPVPIPVPVSLEQYNAATAGVQLSGNQQQTTMAHAYHTAVLQQQQQQQSANQALYSPDGPLGAQQSHKDHTTHSNQPSGGDNNQPM